MRAVFLAIIGFFAFAVMDVCVKWLLNIYPLPQVMFINAAFALLGLLIAILPQRTVLKTANPGLHLGRAILLILIDALAFYSYHQIPLAQAYVLIFMMPIFVCLLAILLRLEKVQRRHLLLITMAFLGGTLVFTPGSPATALALSAALASAFLEAIAMLTVVRYRKQEHPLSFAFYGMVLTLFVTLLLPGWSLTSLTLANLWVGALSGLCYAIANVIVISAFQKGAASTVSSMQYTQLIWAMFLAYIVWGELPSNQAMLGGIIIILCGLFIIRSEANTRLIDPYH